MTSIDLLAELAPRERQAIEQNCRWRRYDPHEQIIDRQSETNEVCFVVEGNVRVVNYSLSGREITLDDLDAGAFFGELAALDGRPRSASVMALTNTLIASLAPTMFLDVLAKHPEIALKFMTHLALVVRNATDRIMDLSTLAANNRVQADLLCQARTTMSDDGKAVIKPIPVHADIASRVSTTRETVARVLSDLAREGIVHRTKDSLVIADVDRLTYMVELVRGE
ncbi:MAG: Crp/Fnr family transcriptional regulator [Rhodospirillales bacterium]|nr:Crp/Fnr family transcriptional regulator [Rhodospirillales bacterium]MDP6804687.1 Crp/Fnr family transcriptional regulator [Rhodospirillales bacterium]